MVFLAVMSILSVHGCESYRASQPKTAKKANHVPVTAEDIMDAASRGDVDSVRKILRSEVDFPLLAALRSVTISKQLFSPLDIVTHCG